jgi:predicted phosphodiesterase
LELSDYSLFALAIGRTRDIQKAAERLSREPLHGELLVLIPHFREQKSNFEVLDPIPAFSVALHAASDWPGMAFWTPNGSSAFVPIRALDELVPDLHEALRGHFDHPRRYRRHRLPGMGGFRTFDRLVKSWADRYTPSSRRLLHLSDLHFGTRDATENQQLLDAELSEVVKSAQRVVITGDLLNSPNEGYFQQFSVFKGSLTRLSGGKEPISITGNHDQRWKGILGSDYKQVANLKSSGVELDQDAEMAFLMLNSSIKGQLARGQITPAQFKRVAAEFRSLTAARSDVKRFLPVVLVHHHPFSFNLPAETFLQRALSRIGVREEALLELKDAAELHRWCLDWGFPTILHGHKHKRRYVSKPITHGGRTIELTAIGCGSSLGAEGSPISYNLLEWNPERGRWVASFFESVNGGAFVEVGLSVSPEEVLQPHS